MLSLLLYGSTTALEQEEIDEQVRVVELDKHVDLVKVLTGKSEEPSGTRGRHR